MNSYWISSTKDFDDNKIIDNNYTADVCIIGAGICGLTTGYYLAKNGIKVIILDKYGIGYRTSGHTTAKITLQHNLIYNYLINSFGIEFASKYFESNKKAIFNIKKIIDTENIQCDFEYQNNYIYTTEQDEVIKINEEINALNKLTNEKYAQFVTNCGLPFNISGAIETKNQAQFHPRKYMLGLQNVIKSYGGLIFTNSQVNDIKKENNKYTSYTNKYTVTSKYVVVASHYPFINFPGFYFSKMYQSTSYAIAIETNQNLFDGMYINTKAPIFSYRTATYQTQNTCKKLLIISGGDHKTGYSPDSESEFGYSILEENAKKLYPDCNILYKWNTRDCITLDKIPYIGEYSIFMPNVYVATGFNKWGMTCSNVAANIITDKILGKENKYSDIYDSTRLSPIKNRQEIKNMSKQLFHSFVSSRIKIPEEHLSSIKNNNGGIIKINDSAVGIFKDKDGKIYAVDPTCTHLGCLLTWNNIDKTWDCPCHGSRFNYDGSNIYEPALNDLNTYTIE